MSPRRQALALYQTHCRYSKSFFISVLIMCFWWLLGVKMQHTHHLQGELGKGLAYFLLTAIMMILSPWIYHYAFRRNFETPAWYQAQLQELHRQLSHEDYLLVYKDWERHGHFPDDIPRLMAVAMLFWIVLFDLFFISAWVDKNGVMVWQPEWAKSIIHWATERTHSYPLSLDTMFSEFRLFNVPSIPEYAPNKAELIQAFIRTPKGQTLMFFHTVSAVNYLIYLVLMCFVLSPFLPTQVSIYSTDFMRTMGRWIWRAVLTCVAFGLTLVVLSTTGAVDATVGKFNFDGWLEQVFFLYLVLGAMPFWSVRCIVVWFLFWKQVPHQFRIWLDSL